jgi:hypothetical protein
VPAYGAGHTYEMDEETASGGPEGTEPRSPATSGRPQRGSELT